MTFVVDLSWFIPSVILGALILFKVTAWYVNVNADREHFKEFMTRVEKTMDSFDRTIEGFRIALENLHKDVAGFNQSLSDLRNYVDQNLNKLRGDIDRIDGNIDRIDGNIDRIDGNIDRIDGNIGRIDGNIDSIYGILRIVFEHSASATDHNSPRRLSDMGEDISKELFASEWARKTAPILAGRAKGKPPYDIQELCYEYVRRDFKPTAELDAKMGECAYQHGISKYEVLDVFAIELRNVLLDTTE